MTGYYRKSYGRNLPMINERIRAAELRLISETGEMLGVMSTSKAIQLAKERGYDLVLISGKDQETPVAKIMDYGKYKFEIEKKAKEQKKKQHLVHVKEIKMRYKIEKHDYLVNVRKAEKFLTHGDKVKASISLYGREMEHKNLGMDLLKRFIEDTKEWGDPEKPPKMEGRQALVILAPRHHK